MNAETLIVNTIARSQYIIAILLITYSDPWKVMNIKREFYNVMLVGLKYCLSSLYNLKTSHIHKNNETFCDLIDKSRNLKNKI